MALTTHLMEEADVLVRHRGAGGGVAHGHPTLPHHPTTHRDATHRARLHSTQCDRVGIMVNGALACLGPTSRLKSKYGSGYQLELIVDLARYEGLALPEGQDVVPAFEGEEAAAGRGACCTGRESGPRSA